MQIIPYLANSLNLLTKFTEIGDQIHWIYIAISLNLLNKHTEFTHKGPISIRFNTAKYNTK